MSPGSAAAGGGRGIPRCPGRDTGNTTVGLVGFGAFGRLIAAHTAAYFELMAYDPAPGFRERAIGLGVAPVDLETAARCDVVVLAVPVSSLERVVGEIARYCRPGAFVIDVASVKVWPVEVMRDTLPDQVRIIATHPLFGPESARDGIAGLKIAVCPVRGPSHCLVAFLRERLHLEVIETTPEAHDRDAATVQGLTHLIAKVLSEMGPVPTRMTTPSFDLLVRAISMVRDDPPEVFDAIETMNPYAQDVRRAFLERVAGLDRALCDRAGLADEDPGPPEDGTMRRQIGSDRDFLSGENRRWHGDRRKARRRCL